MLFDRKFVLHVKKCPFKCHARNFCGRMVWVKDLLMGREKRGGDGWALVLIAPIILILCRFRKSDGAICQPASIQCIMSVLNCERSDNSVRNRLINNMRVNVILLYILCRFLV